MLWKENIREFMKRIRQRPVRSGGSGQTDRTMWVVRSDEDGDGRTKMGTNPDTAQHAKQARMHELNDSPAQSRSARTPDPTTGSNEPRGDHRPPTDESFPWNDEFHKKIINECDRQDCINWECKLEALAHLLSIAEAKRAIATVHGHLDTHYIEANQRICDARDAID